MQHVSMGLRPLADSTIDWRDSEITHDDSRITVVRYYGRRNRLIKFSASLTCAMGTGELIGESYGCQTRNLTGVQVKQLGHINEWYAKFGLHDDLVENR